MTDEREKNNFPIVLAIILIVFTFNTIRSIQKLRASHRQMDDMQTEISEIINENTNLRQEIVYAQSEEFIEQQAAEQLRLTKPGYSILIVNEVQPSDLNREELKLEIKLKNWQKWANRFGFY